MFKYLLAVLVLIFGALAAMYFWIGAPAVHKEEFPEISAPRHYANPEQSLADIRILAFYFVPKNKTQSQLANWREILEKNLEKLKEFHFLQFQGRSALTYEIYPQPLVGFKDNLFYDTEVTRHGNPQGLRRVFEEIEEREDLPGPSPGVYRVFVIMYEGVGAAGSENVAFVSSKFLSDPQYGAVSASILAHEFYHTLGIPDGYEIETAVPTTQDIMGAGRLSPLEKTYLDRATLRALGI